MTTKDDIDIISILTRCKKIQVADDVETLLNHIKSLVRGNLFALFVCVVALLVCIIGVGYIINTAFAVIQDYYKKKWTSQHISAFQVEKNNDKYTYKSQPDTNGTMEETEQAMLTGNMQRIRAKYSGYNRALSGYLNTKGLENDDAIDESILVEDNDNFKYGKHPR